jgi:hypothetical protein
MELRVYRSAAELAEIAQCWRDMQHHPNSDYDHFLLVCATRREVIGPFVIGLFEDGSLKGLVVGRRERTALSSRIGYARVAGLGATAVTVIHGGLIGDVDSSGAREISAELSGLLERGEADVVVVNLLPEQATLWEALRALRVRSTGGVGWSIHRSLTLQTEQGFLLKNMRSKHRSWIKRKQKDLEEAFSAQVCWSWHSSIDDVTPLCMKMELVSRQTYQRGLGAGFVNDAETRARLALFAGHGQLRIILLEVARVPKAFWYGQVYRGVFHSAATGYSNDVRQFEAGTLLFLQMVDRLVEEGVGALDFGLGDAPYKERFGDRVWREASKRLYAPTSKGAILWALQRAMDASEQVSRAAVDQFGGTGRLKRLWRARLQQKASHEQPSSAD